MAAPRSGGRDTVVDGARKWAVELLDLLRRRVPLAIQFPQQLAQAHEMLDAFRGDELAAFSRPLGQGTPLDEASHHRHGDAQSIHGLVDRQEPARRSGQGMHSLAERRLSGAAGVGHLPRQIFQDV